MGLWDKLTAGKRIEEIKMAYVGKYVYDKKLSQSEKEIVHNLATKNAIQYFGHFNPNNDLLSENERVRFIFYALAMAELRINHSLPSYEWFYIKNPFMVAIIEDSLWENTKNIVKKQYGIEITIAK